MEAQIARPREHGSPREQYPLSTTGVTHGEEQHRPGDQDDQPDKKSVLRKVKAKAKKIKDTLKHHGQGHDEHREYDSRDTPEDRDLEEEDEEGNHEMLDHGAPGCEVAGATEIKEVPTSPANTPASPSAGIAERRDDPDRVGNLVRDQEARRGQPELGHEIHAALEEDPHAHRSQDRAPPNYQAKTIDPTAAGGGEAGSSPIVASFGKMIIQDEPEQGAKQKSPTEAEQTSMLPTGSHGQFSPEPTPTKPTNDEQDVPKTDVETSDASESTSLGSYKEKISSATAAIADRAVSAKNVITSRLGMGEKQEPGSPESKLGMGEKQEPGSPESKVGMGKKREPGSPESQEERGGSSATGSIADKAVYAKNVVTSKLGMGEMQEPGSPESEVGMGEKREPGRPESQEAQGGGSPVEYGKKMATTVADKLSPVYEKVAGAGTAVISRVRSPGASSEGKEKGASVKEYFAEKLKPGEEDKALSEVISETLSKKKAEREEVEAEGTRPMGKVTESEEVKRQLGSSMEEDVGDDPSSMRIPGKNVVDKLKGAVGSWMAKGQESSPGSSPGIDQVSSASATSEELEQRRLQESGN